jgi:hypothetical protein
LHCALSGAERAGKRNRHDTRTPFRQVGSAILAVLLWPLLLLGIDLHIHR